MLYAVVWFSVLLLLALWSLTVWGFHAIGVWTVAQAGALTGVTAGAGTAAAAVRLPEWLAPWIEPWLPAEGLPSLAALLAGVQPMIDSLLQFAPALAGGLTVMAWGAWGLGALLLLSLGFGGHLLAAFWRRRGDRGAPPSAGLQAG